MSRSCSQCGNNGHNSRTCRESPAAAGPIGGGAPSSSAATGGENGIMLFGVRVTTEGCLLRKSVSMNNLSQYEPQPQTPTLMLQRYESDDVVHALRQEPRAKRGVPWSEEEHKLFLLGLQKVGKGDWRGISRNFVKTLWVHQWKKSKSTRNCNCTTATTATLQQYSCRIPMSTFPVSLSPAVLEVAGDNTMENLSLGSSNQTEDITEAHSSNTNYSSSSIFKNG
ncbi:hypothetical protein GH714_027425 [Hevea brasiliensis]|uniref:CCHC-type domain-containing protein n=1 Tax=Hevea brasiliensis TaxID=3981 RepID=A0A6A6NJN0_HEVBR|nr:hypothetical protein GH714_027425 [Hevea brasiliensis]